MITSSTTLGALIGGLAAGTMSDFTGRKPVIALSNVVFIAGALLQTVSQSVTSVNHFCTLVSCKYTHILISCQASNTVRAMVFGRFIVGLGVGLASCIIPLYIGELSPTLIRGKLVNVNNVAVTLGQVVAYGGYVPPSISPILTCSNRGDVSTYPGRLEMDGRSWCHTINYPATCPDSLTRIA